MEVIAAAGSAATVVQLADFAGKLIQSTTSFLAALAGASRDLDELHRRIDHLKKILEHTRALGCSYQNSQLGLELQNQKTLDLLGQALTACSIDLQSLNSTLQKPLGETGWRIIRMKRRVKHILDEQLLRRLSLRIEGHLTYINWLLTEITV
jgi:paraquat-inducible protein B